MEEALVGRLRAGECEALEQAYRNYKADVLALVVAILGRQDGALDILHDVFVSLARNAPNLAPDTNLKGYLLTAGANRARSQLSKRSSKLLQLEPTNELECHLADDPSDIASDKEEGERLWEAVASLPDEQRIAVALRIYGGMTSREIAARDGVSVNTVESRYRYGLEKIRQQFLGGGK